MILLQERLKDPNDPKRKIVINKEIDKEDSTLINYKIQVSSNSKIKIAKDDFKIKEPYTVEIDKVIGEFIPEIVNSFYSPDSERILIFSTLDNHIFSLKISSNEKNN